MTFKGHGMALVACGLLLLLQAGCNSFRAACPFCGGGMDAAYEKAPQAAEETQPIEVGSALPQLTLATVNGEPFDLNAAIAEQPTVLVFYRGGWCMFCNRQLAELQAIHPTLKDMGYRLIGVSPDRPAELAASIGKHKLDYTLLSDSDMRAALALGLAFRLADATDRLYRTKYSIDIEAASGFGHHLLPVPAVLIMDTAGQVRYRFSDPDYKVRLDPATLLKQAAAALERR